MKIKFCLIFLSIHTYPLLLLSYQFILHILVYKTMFSLKFIYISQRKLISDF